MNPYSVPPGAARKLWLDMFDNVRNLRRCFQNRWILVDGLFCNGLRWLTPNVFFVCSAQE
jgi:hypothetical protein